MKGDAGIFYQPRHILTIDNMDIDLLQECGFSFRSRTNSNGIR